MWGTTWQLCARLLPTIPHRDFVVKESETTWGTWRIVPGSLQPCDRLTGPFALGPGDVFPYGMAVLPD